MVHGEDGLLGLFAVHVDAVVDDAVDAELLEVLHGLLLAVLEVAGLSVTLLSSKLQDIGTEV